MKWSDPVKIIGLALLNNSLYSEIWHKAFVILNTVLCNYYLSMKKYNVEIILFMVQFSTNTGRKFSWSTVLPVSFQMLADSYSLLDQVVQIFWKVWSQSHGFHYPQDLVARDKSHLGNSMWISKNDTWSKYLNVCIYIRCHSLLCYNCNCIFYVIILIFLITL